MKTQQQYQPNFAPAMVETSSGIRFFQPSAATQAMGPAMSQTRTAQPQPTQPQPKR